MIASTAFGYIPANRSLKRFRELVRQKLGKEALRGAVFVDPTAKKPYLFHLARLTVIRKADPEIPELAHEETVECRLVGVKQTESAEISICPVEHLLLLRGGQGLPPQAQRMAVEAQRLRDQARAYFTERVCRSLAVECRERRMASLPERESFVQRGYDFQEAELATARTKMAQKARTGNKGAAAELTRIKAQQRDLSDRLEKIITLSVESRSFWSREMWISSLTHWLCPPPILRNLNGAMPMWNRLPWIWPRLLKKLKGQR